MYAVRRHWHKRIVRAGWNTLAPYDENPPDLTVMEDDIVFIDLGPVFEEWEADFGRTYVVGNDPRKRKLCQDIKEAFAKGKRYFQERPDITCAELYEYAQSLARDTGWEYGGPIAGHLVGVFPHEKIAGDKITLYVHPENPNRMRTLDANGANDTGFSKFILYIEPWESVAFTKNCLRFEPYRHALLGRTS